LIVRPPEGRRKTVSGRLDRVTSCDRFASGALEVAVVMLLARTGAAVAVTPVLLTLLVESSSSQMAPAKIDCKTAGWVVFKLICPAVMVGRGLMAIKLAFAAMDPGPSLIEKTRGAQHPRFCQ